jgi:hypothetical protein
VTYGAIASRRSVSLLSAGAFGLAPRWRVSADCRGGNQRSHASLFGDELIWAKSHRGALTSIVRCHVMARLSRGRVSGGASDVFDNCTFTDASYFRSSIGQCDPRIGQIEGLEGCLVKVAMALHRTSKAFGSFEMAQRESFSKREAKRRPSAGTIRALGSPVWRRTTCQCSTRTLSLVIPINDAHGSCASCPFSPSFSRPLQGAVRWIHVTCRRTEFV